jgi:hypothetical protein
MQILFILGAMVLTLPGVFLRLTGTHLDPLTAALLYGLAVVGAAFLLAWAAEVAQHDIPRALALTILALIAVLPEYAVDMYLTWRAADNPAEYGPLALVNMTGANRLLIGIGWPTVVLIYWLAARRAGKPAIGVALEPEQGVEITFLLLATLYSFIIPFTGIIQGQPVDPAGRHDPAGLQYLLVCDRQAGAVQPGPGRSPARRSAADLSPIALRGRDTDRATLVTA